MKATALLEKQHREVDALFKAYEGAKSPDAKANGFDRIAAALVAHDAIERELFYPACEKLFGKDEDILQESLVEHGIVEFCLFRGNQHRKSDKLDAYVKALKDAVEHHVEEEEKELLPKVNKAMDDRAHEALGEAMERRFAAAMKVDFRRPLRANLAQVLAGRTKTTPKKSPRPRPLSAKKARRGGTATSSKSGGGKKRTSRKSAKRARS